MMKHILIAFSIAMLPVIAAAQLSGALNRAKNKIQSRIDQKMDKALDEELNKVGGKKSESQQAGSEQPASAAEVAVIKSYSRYDFVAGEKILYAEDFTQDEVGELPVNWNASGKGFVVALENQEGKWLRLFPGVKYLGGNKKPFGENYTIEFDLILDGTTPSGTRFFPSFSLGFFASGNNDPADNILFRELMERNLTMISITPNADAISKMQLSSRDNNYNTFESEKQVVASYSKSFLKPAHYAIQVQKNRIRFWVNEEKVFDIPKAVNTSSVMNNLFFNVAEYFPYHDNNFGLYISNLKVATGLPDSRHKLLEEGKFSTTGILFDVQSAVIKPESYGVIKEIATVLNENPAVKIKVVGHTSSDGDDAANLELSKQRAAAVKNVMEKEFKIDASRIQTEGKGETNPVADNKTKEGKMQNRRVEFIRL